MGVRLLGLSLWFSIMAPSIFPFLSSSLSAPILSAAASQSLPCADDLYPCALCEAEVCPALLCPWALGLFCCAPAAAGLGSVLLSQASCLYGAVAVCLDHAPVSDPCENVHGPADLRPDLTSRDGQSQGGDCWVYPSRSCPWSKWSSSGRSVLSLLSFLAWGWGGVLFERPAVHELRVYPRFSGKENVTRNQVLCQY